MVRYVDRSRVEACKPSPDNNLQERRGYRVRILYTEPAFQERLANAPDFYTIEYFIKDAATPEEAERAAMRDWDFCLHGSRVGWGRFIQSIEIDQPKETPTGAWEISC